MPALNHVYEFTENRWKHVTADQIDSDYAVSHRSGIFMCWLCRKNVDFIPGGIYSPYFRHSKYDDDKNCPERTFSSSAPKAPLSPKEHNLPLRLIIDNNNFRFELGLICLLHKIPDTVTTITASDNNEKFTYNLQERLNEKGITYLPVGEEPSEFYTIETSADFKCLWNKTQRGIYNSKPNVFDGRTCRKLPIDADVQINRTYYVLTHRSLYDERDIRITKILERHSWRVYEVEARVCFINAGHE